MHITDQTSEVGSVCAVGHFRALREGKTRIIAKYGSFALGIAVSTPITVYNKLVVVDPEARIEGIPLALMTAGSSVRVTLQGGPLPWKMMTGASRAGSAEWWNQIERIDTQDGTLTQIARVGTMQLV